ncbi:hypothetical protein D9753_25130 [Streptomyces dangxiongensis]|uniref:Secreted protein n=1 Tax=Streptomyces dangxiongensis TaxID=1442032 RepID=A0A3G2JPD0_9ACTN|nr:hypothetical protein [Streptomyces dangxiongensis]AYN41617.1 hypothetical protein D9753_25130 [Streptomyces dangxiongensis]
MNTKLRIAAATATAAIALGVAAPLASASEAARTPTVAAVQAQAVKDAGAVNAFTVVTSGRVDAPPAGVTAKGQINDDLRELAKDIVDYLKKKAKADYNKAKAAAKKGYAAFVKWVKSLKPNNPVRIILEIGGKKLIDVVITFLR